MAKLADVKGRSQNKLYEGAYYRCFGDIQLSRLLSRVQSLIIKNGHELERMVAEYGGEHGILVDNLDRLLLEEEVKKGLYLVEKKVIRESNPLESGGIAPDFLVFRCWDSSQECYVTELKDGHEFGVKSSIMEESNLRKFSEANKEQLHSWAIHWKIVGFNAQTKDEIIEGFKRKIDDTVAMTGAEFCELLGLDYGLIQSQRALDREGNLQEFIEELGEIDVVREQFGI